MDSGAALRIFVAVDVPETVRRRLVRFSSEFEADVYKAKWVRPQAMHLTLLFLGNLQEPELERVKSAVSALDFQPFTLDLTSIGTFCRENGAVLWAGLSEHPELLRIAGKLRSDLSGFSALDGLREFVPHITMARFKTIRKVNAFEDKVRRLEIGEHLSFCVNQVKVYASELTPQGSVYTELFVKNAAS